MNLHNSLRKYRLAALADVPVIAGMSLQLIRDEGHRNPMTLAQLCERMETWLAGQYEAVLFEQEGVVCGYALFRRDVEYVYLRHLFVAQSFRRFGIGRDALAWLWQNAWGDCERVRLEVLVRNVDFCEVAARPIPFVA